MGGTYLYMRAARELWEREFWAAKDKICNQISAGGRGTLMNGLGCWHFDRGSICDRW